MVFLSSGGFRLLTQPPTMIRLFAELAGHFPHPPARHGVGRGEI
jgi:hypothetical protein